MAAPKGNRYSFEALAYCKTTEHRQAAFKAYCAHIADGNLKESFNWESPDGKAKATYRSIKNIMDKYGEELSLLDYEIAEAKNLQKWQSLAYELSSGAKKGEGFVWINNMHNRFRHLGWNISQPRNDDKLSAESAEGQEKLSGIADGINE